MNGFSEARAYLSTAADELEEYLLSGAAHWRLSGPDSLPPLTPGEVLLNMKHLDGSNSADSAAGQIQEVIDKIYQVRMRWKSAWIKRIGQELPQRMHLWANYLDELAQSINQGHPEYRWNVRWRVIIALLTQEIGDPDPGISQSLRVLDERLRAFSHAGPFIWEEPLERVFNPVDFWFLYLKINHS